MLTLNTLFARPVLAPVLAIAGAATCLSFAAPAAAASASEPRSVFVRLDAADLSASKATTTIHHRIASAARQVCAPEGRTLKEHMIARQCFDSAVRSAEAQLLTRRDEAKLRQQTLAAAER